MVVNLCKKNRRATSSEAFKFLGEIDSDDPRYLEFIELTSVDDASSEGI